MKPIRFDIITIFPEIFNSYFHEGMIRKGLEKKIIEIKIHNLRDYTNNKWGKIDDTPYGGGPGMVMTPEPLYNAIKAIKKLNAGPVVYMSPKGTILTHTKAKRLSNELINQKSKRGKSSGMIIVCGRYEGIDQRIIELCIDKEISIGKYILTGGELAAMVVIDSVSRFIPNLLGDKNSHLEESFSRKLGGKKEYPHYTKPKIFKKLKVPDILLSGNHAKIAKWRESNTNK